MKKYLNLYCFLVVSGLLLRTQAQVDVPYFYYLSPLKSGKQRCNCAPNAQCRPNGTCPGDSCRAYYAGSTCQHADISLLAPQTLCFPSRSGVTVTYQINSPIHFIWIHLSGQSDISVNFNLELFKDNKKQHVDVYYLKLNDNSLLIKSRQDVLFDYLQLSNLPGHSCSLKVSIGRNLAISSTPDQSSVWSKSRVSKSQEALKAIDGSDSNRFFGWDNIHCTHTKWSTKAWWEAQLKYDALVNTVYIINRNEKSCRLMYYIVQTFPLSRVPVFQHEEKGLGKQRYIMVPVATETSIRRIRVSTLQQQFDDDQSNCTQYGMLSICELYIFGEFRCPDNWYGPLCERECPNGCSREKCDPDWGCPQGCNEGWTGHWCETNNAPIDNATLFDSETVMEGASATLTCDARKVAPNATVDSVQSLVVSKKAASDRPTDFQWMIHYNVSRNYDKDEHRIAPWITEGKSNGRITLSFGGLFSNGSQLEGNAEGTRIVMTFNEVLCEDSAIYRCEATYQLPNNGLTKGTMDTTFKVIGRVTEITWQARPDKKVYQEEDTVTITCLTFGPSDVTIRWKYQTCPSGSVQNITSHDWQPVSDISNANEGTIQFEGCTYTRFKSVLNNAKLSTRERTICQIQCVAGVVGQDGGSFVEHRQWSKTITYVAPSASHFFIAMNWDLVLALCAIGALLVLGTVVGIYDRYKGRQVGTLAESNHVDQSHKNDVTTTSVEIPHTEDTVEPGVISPTNDAVVGVTSPTNDAVVGVTSPTNDAVVGVTSPTNDAVIGVTSSAAVTEV